MRHRLQITSISASSCNNGPLAIDNHGSWKQTSKSINHLVCAILIISRDEEAAVEVEVVEGEAVDAGVVAGKTIESASKRSRSITKNSKDITTAF